MLKRDRWFWIGVMAAVGLLLDIAWTLAHSATIPAVTISWTTPTAYADGSPIPTGTVFTYQLYVGTAGHETAYKTPVTAPPYVLVPTPPPGSQVCVQITASIAGQGESDRSVENCVKLPNVSKPPGNVAISVK